MHGGVWMGLPLDDEDGTEQRQIRGTRDVTSISIRNRNGSRKNVDATDDDVLDDVMLNEKDKYVTFNRDDRADVSPSGRRDYRGPITLLSMDTLDKIMTNFYIEQAMYETDLDGNANTDPDPVEYGRPPAPPADPSTRKKLPKRVLDWWFGTGGLERIEKAVRDAKYFDEDMVLTTEGHIVQPLGGVMSVCWVPEVQKFFATGGRNFGVSSDGETWKIDLIPNEISSSDSTFAWTSICWSPKLQKLLVVGLDEVGRSGFVVKDLGNGSKWKHFIPRESEDNDNLQTVIWCAPLRKFIAAGDVIMTSRDGEHWKKHSLPCESPRTSQFCVEALCWSPKQKKLIGVGCNYEDVWMNGSKGVHRSFVLSSKNGTAWKCVKEIEGQYQLTSVCWSAQKNIYVAIGFEVIREETIPVRSSNSSFSYGYDKTLLYTKLVCFVSADAKTWTKSSISDREFEWSGDMIKPRVHWSERRQMFYASSPSEGQRIFFSPNGTLWTPLILPTHLTRLEERIFRTYSFAESDNKMVLVSGDFNHNESRVYYVKTSSSATGNARSVWKDGKITTLIAPPTRNAFAGG